MNPLTAAQSAALTAKARAFHRRVLPPGRAVLLAKALAASTPQQATEASARAIAAVLLKPSPKCPCQRVAAPNRSA